MYDSENIISLLSLIMNIFHLVALSITDLTPGQAGLILSYVMSFVWALESATRLSSEVEIEVKHK